ncbi:MAG TPA: DNRLRE domain-containing protein, partial [Anaerolineae bacterium]|nr:DNRLRE domain-containing protein [Anaerolineae bacterium]
LKPFSSESRAEGFDLRLDREDAIDDIFNMVQVVPLQPLSTPTPSPTPPSQIKTIRLQQGLEGFQGFTDTYLSKWQPNKTFAKKTVLALRINNVMVSLLKVDLSAIPRGARILDATLHLTRVDPRSPTVRVNAYALLRDWDENATYNRASKGMKWQRPGALGSRDASKTPINATPVVVPKGGTATFDLTTLVQTWVKDPTQNHGIILRGESNTNKQYSFGSSDARKLSLRPYLEIRYIADGATPTAPPPSPTPTPAPPTATPTHIPSPSPTPPPPPTATPIPTPTPRPTAAPTQTPTPSPTATTTPSPTPTPAATCSLRLEQRLQVGPHPKGVTAWPQGFLVGMFDDGSLAVFDGKLTKVATSGQAANDVVYRNGLAYLVHRNSADISVVDPVARNVVATIPVGKLPWGAAANDERLFVANFADNTVTTIDLDTNQPLATTSVHGLPALAAAGADTGYITHLDGYVSVIGNDGTVRTTFGPLPGGEAFGVALDETGNRLFVSNRRTKQVVVLDSRSGEVLRRVDVAPYTPYALAFDARWGLVFALDAVRDQLLAIRPDTGDIVAQGDVSRQDAKHGGQFLAIAANGERVYVPAFDAGVVDVFRVEGCRR